MPITICADAMLAKEVKPILALDSIRHVNSGAEKWFNDMYLSFAPAKVYVRHIEAENCSEFTWDKYCVDVMGDSSGLVCHYYDEVMDSEVATTLHSFEDLLENKIFVEECDCL